MTIIAVPWRDLLERDGEALVLYAGKVVRLGALGAAILKSAEKGIELDALCRDLEEQFGAPPEGTLEDAVRGKLSELLGEGIVEIDDRPLIHG